MERVQLNYLQEGLVGIGKKKVWFRSCPGSRDIIRLTEMNSMNAGGMGRELRGC